MERQISRRGFLKKSAIALGSVAVCDLRGANTLFGNEVKEKEMPHVIVKLWPGRSEQEKQQLADAIVKDVVAHAKCVESSVSVAIEEIKSSDWAEKVYKPDILTPRGKLYRKPGYTMSIAGNRRAIHAPLCPHLPAKHSTNNRKEANMKYTAMLLSLSLFVSTGAFAGQALAAEANKATQTITRAGSQPSVKGSSEYFTGNVRVDPLFPAKDAAPFSGAYVTFEPGARSAWHTHPTGQHLIVTVGVGRTGEWGGRVEEIRTGDVIWCSPTIKHWHGASPTTAMTHIAITGTLDGKNVVWMEKVTDAQYNGK